MVSAASRGAQDRDTPAFQAMFAFQSTPLDGLDGIDGLEIGELAHPPLWRSLAIRP